MPMEASIVSLLLWLLVLDTSWYYVARAQIKNGDQTVSLELSKYPL